MGMIGSMKQTVLAVVILLSGLAAACGGGDGDGGGGNGSSDLTPARANMVGTVAAGEALDAIDLELDQFLEMLTSASEEDDGLDELFAIEQFQTGGLFGDVSRADIFAEATDGGDDVEYFGVLLSGSFDEASLVSELESLSGTDLIASVYKETNFYSPADDEDEFELSVLDGSTFAFGTGGAINDVIDIRAGDAKPASGALIDTLDELDGGLFAIAVQVPQDFAGGSDLGSGSPLGDLPISLDFISALEIIGISGNLNGGTLDLKVTADFSDASAAESLEGFIKGIAALAGGLASGPGAAGLLEGMEVGRDGSLLTITVEIPLADIPDLFGDLTTITSTETSSSSARPPGTPEIRLLQSAVGVQIPVERSRDHVPEGQTVEYRTIPPTSGEHWGQWADCGFYAEALPDERIVHNLEHGNIVVSYNFANPAQVTDLRDALEDLDLFEDWGVARPYDKIGDGQVVLTAWGRMHPMIGVRSGEIEQFFEAFAGELGPETVPC